MCVKMYKKKKRSESSKALKTLYLTIWSLFDRGPYFQFMANRMKLWKYFTLYTVHLLRYVL